MTGIGFRLNGLLVGRCIETRPPGAGVVLCIRTKQRLAATYALIDTGGVSVLILACERRLRTLLTRHIVLIRRELLLPSPFVLTNLIVHSSPCYIYGFGLCPAAIVV